MIGDAYGSVVHAAFPAWTAAAPAYALVAMAAAFAAAAEAPITAIVIVFEMSGDYTIVLPLMIATVISSLVGRRLLGATVYEMKLLRRGIDWGAVPQTAAARTRARHELDASARGRRAIRRTRARSSRSCDGRDRCTRPAPRRG